MFDTYAQKSNNLQVWNEELSPTRRYVILRVDDVDQIARVKVVNGEELVQLDTTGTLTQKYQARLIPGEASEELVSPTDTDALMPHTRAGANLAQTVSPIDHPAHGLILPIGEVFERLRGAVGRSFPDAGWDEERNRGAALHRIVCELLGYADYRHDGRFPDVRNQLLEVKLQTSPTIDLGLVRPASEEPLDVPQIAGTQALLRNMDVTKTIRVLLPSASSRARASSRRLLTRPIFRPKPRKRPRIESSMAMAPPCNVLRVASKARISWEDTDLQCTGRNHPMRSSCAIPSASRRSVLIGIAFKAPFTCRVSIRTVVRPASVRCLSNHCDNGPASIPMQITSWPNPCTKAINAGFSKSRPAITVSPGHSFQ